MFISSFRILLPLLTAALGLFWLLPETAANPVVVRFVDTAAQCADPGDVNLDDEVGPMPPFDADERISYSVAAATAGDCAFSIGGGNDYTVTATNLSGKDLSFVFAVVDSGTTFDNWDGTIGGFRAKKIADVWLAGATIGFTLMNSSASPTFDSVGLNSGDAASNYSIVARCDDCVPTLSGWGVIAMGGLLMGAACIAIRRRKLQISSTA